MLHVAYSRLSEEELDDVQDLLNEELDELGNRKILEQLSKFRSTADFLNEAHSYVGTEEAQLIPGLERHYELYFEERSKTVEAYRASPEY